MERFSGGPGVAIHPIEDMEAVLQGWTSRGAH